MPNTYSFWRVATEASVIKRAIRIALIVGTVIAIINHGDRMVQGTMDAAAWLKCLLTFLVPYAVSTYSSVMAVRDRM
ncbi:nitrate/nitrite transporter NrtS [Tateyamaria pelophila]|uniref:nitrate/nitrite transporter NrtS n=1 Tax=Tateyamaria pelophila TaxID=328415 RepID=UPI001CC024BA|nr:nitrate/nitrite transporter NrtS [Tateyamaria pelophila]